MSTINIGHRFEVCEGYTKLRLEGSLDFSQCKAFDEQIEPMLNSPINHLIVDCQLLMNFSKDWVRSLLRLQLAIKAAGKGMRLININQSISTYLKKEGIDSAFVTSKSLTAALLELGVMAKRTIDMEFVDPFLTATLHVLKVQASVESKAGKPFVKKPNEMLIGDVSGVIGVVSDAFNGSVVISFPEKTFLNVMSGMLGEEIKVLDKEIIDGAGEITNMIFGQAKVVLNNKGYGIKMAIPSVVSGKGHSLSALTKGPIVIIPFESNVGDFFVEICLSE
jgi:chemotaxis protein CheX